MSCHVESCRYIDRQRQSLVRSTMTVHVVRSHHLSLFKERLERHLSSRVRMSNSKMAKQDTILKIIFASSMCGTSMRSIMGRTYSFWRYWSFNQCLGFTTQWRYHLCDGRHSVFRWASVVLEADLHTETALIIRYTLHLCAVQQHSVYLYIVWYFVGSLNSPNIMVF